MAKLDSIPLGREGDFPEPMPALNEEAALARFTAVRWKHGAFCPRCGASQVYHFCDNRTHKCGACRQRFSAKVGTIFEDSKVGLAAWLVAIELATASSWGVTAAELSRRVGVTPKTAAQMLQRLRLAAQTPSFNRPLDETFGVDATPLSTATRLDRMPGETVA